jgi:hypothetical protein
MTNTRTLMSGNVVCASMSMLWTPEWDPPRPHVHPLRAPSGRTLTAAAPADHPWHFGLWSTIKFVNGENFWETYGEFGTLSTVDVQADGATTTATIDWVAPDGDAIALRETRTLRHVEIESDCYAIDWSFSLDPTVDTEFDRTPFTSWGGYGGLTLRGAHDWTDTDLRLPDGDSRDRVLGEQAWWCALSSDAATVAILDHPSNPRAPTPWYGSNRADTYGDGWANFLNAAFLWDAPLRCAAGDPLRRDHRVVIADGRLSTDRINDLADVWRRS